MDQNKAWIDRVLQNTYRIERVIGKGGMGIVLQASHLRLARTFAIKVLLAEVAGNEEVYSRMRREAQITSSIGHRHIVEVIDFNTTEEGQPYIVMEYLEGEDLSRRILEKKALELAAVTRIFRQAASALAAAHSKGIVHRDLKPQNIFLCQDTEDPDFVKVLDFGISKTLGATSDLTRTQALMGSPYYMSPEQAKQEAREVDATCDVFAMGIILYEMLIGRPPFLGDSIPTVLYQIVHADPPPLRSLRPDVPEELARVISKALSKRREDRYPNMREFWRAFAAALNARGVHEVACLEALSSFPEDPLRDTGPSASAPLVSSGLSADAVGRTWPQNLPRVSEGAIEIPPGSTKEIELQLRRTFVLRKPLTFFALPLLLVAGGGILYWSWSSRARPVMPPRAAPVVQASPSRTPLQQREWADGGRVPDAQQTAAVKPSPSKTRPLSPKRSFRSPKKNAQAAGNAQPAGKLSLNLSVLIDGSPGKAEVFLDEASQGIAPQFHFPELRPGKHSLRVRREGYDEVKKEILLSLEEQSITIRLNKKK